MNSYFAYIRVSTVKQGEHGSSLHEQRNAIEAYAARHGLQITKWFEEMETAAKEGRRAFSQMLIELRRSRSTGLIVHKIDRSARNLRDWSSVIELIDRGIEVHFAHDSVDLRTRGGRLTADIQAVIAADYIRNLREEVIKGIRGRLNQGLWPFAAPLGYCNQGGGQLKTIDPVTGSLIQEAFRLYASGRFPLNELRHEMASRGLRKQGRPLSINVMATLLRNPFYVGLLRLKGTGDLFQGAHEPLISQRTFTRAQAVMDGRLYQRPGKHDFLFTRRIRCCGCGRSLIGERQRGHVYYRCHNRHCRGTSINETAIFGLLAEVAACLKMDFDEMGDLRDLRDEAEGKEAGARASWLDQQQMLLGRCQDRLSRLTDAFTDGDVDKETFKLRQAELLSERRSLLDGIQSPPQRSAAVDKLIKLERGKYCVLALDKANSSDWREMLETTVSNIGVEGKSPLIRLQPEFQNLVEKRLLKGCAPHRLHIRTDGFITAPS